MALRITDLTIDTSNFDSFILTQIRPFYSYINGEKTEIIEGYTYSCAIPSLKFEKLNVKVKQSSPLFPIDEDIPTSTIVEFKDLVVGSYYMNNNVHIKASAENVILKEKQNVNVKA